MKIKVLNIVFLGVFVFLVSSTLLLKVANHAGVEFPSWIGVGKEESYLEGRQYQNFPIFNLETVTSTEFQDDFEQFISDQAPMRDDALLLNANIQKTFIAFSNLPFNFEVYPTFYGSNYVYSPTSDSLYETLATSDSEEEAKYRLGASAFNDFALRHPDIKMYFYRVDRISSSNNNPTETYVSDPINTDFLSNNFFEQLDSNIKVINGLLNDSNNYSELYYRTDHHWNISYAYGAYIDTLDALGYGDSPTSFTVEEFTSPEFYGSLSRSGLCIPKSPDHIEDYYMNIPGLIVKVDGKEYNQNFLDHYETYSKGEWRLDRFTNRYAEYFHTDYGLLEIHNTNLRNNRSILIVGDSYTNNMERFFATNYENVYVYDARFCDITLDDFMSENSINDVVFIMGSTNFATAETLHALECDTKSLS